jgi:NitT/TauT family transport system substrate-binding protein
MRYRIPAVAAAAGAALVLAACSSGGSSSSGAAAGAGSNAGGGTTKTVNLKVACAATLQQLPFDIAKKNGDATKAGLNPQCVQVQTGPAQSAALLSGDLNVAIMTPANLFPLLDKKQDLVIFAGGWSTNYWDILVRKDVSLPDASQGWQGVMKDLQGKRIGVVARGGAAEGVAHALFQQAGLPADAASYIPTGLPNTTLAALQGKAIDAAITFEPGVTLGVQQGIGTEPFSIQKGTGPKEMVFADQVFVASRKYAEKNKDSLCRLTKTWDAGLQYVQDSSNASAVDAEAASFLGLKPDQAKALMDRNLSFFPKTSALDASTIDPSFAFQQKYGGAKKAYTLSDIGVQVCS